MDIHFPLNKFYILFHKLEIYMVNIMFLYIPQLQFYFCLLFQFPQEKNLNLQQLKDFSLNFYYFDIIFIRL